MDVVDDLLAQRDAVLFRTWVNRQPEGDDEVCLLVSRLPVRGECSVTAYHLDRTEQRGGVQE